MWDLIVSVPDHCLSFYFTENNTKRERPFFQGVIVFSYFQNCRDNTVGPECAQCAPGYYGDARRGTPQDCRPCPCPLTDPANQ